MNKNNNTKSSSSGGLGVLGVLQIIFIVLKVLDVISWSWWAVFIPTFIGLGIAILVFLIGIIIALVALFLDKKY